MKIKPEIGIIFGSRILTSEVIVMFEVGILCLYPGLLPENRGLNTIQNAVFLDKINK
jgi:methionyl-tRNA formyltransferase